MSDQTAKPTHRIVWFRSRDIGVLLSLVVLVVLILASGASTRAAFLGETNLQNLSRQIALLGVFAIGETLVIIAGGIDLSVGSLIAFSGVLCALMLDPSRMNVPMPLAIVIVIAIAAVIGIIHALLISRIGLQPFVATLGTMCVLRGASLLLTDSVPVAINLDKFNALGNERIGSIPIPVLFLILVFVFAALLMRKSTWGRYIYAIGSNEEAARLSGVDVGRIKMLAYGLCSALAGLAGVLYAAYDRQGNPSSGVAYELNAIASSVIGGCSLAGGEGSIIGTVIGSSMLMVILNGLNLVVQKNASLWEGVIVGTVVIAAVAFNTIRQKRSGV